MTYLPKKVNHMNTVQSKIEDNIRLLKDFNLSNVEISYLPNKSLNIKIDSSIINFDVFIEKDSRTNRNSFHIFFNANTNSIKTAQYIKENHSDFFKFDVFFYLLRRKSNNTAIIDSIKKLYSKRTARGSSILTSIDYACDIVKKISKIKSDLNFEPIMFDVPSAFINPTIKINPLSLDDIDSNKTSKATKEYIVEWFENSNKPILVTLGKGGVGKTTIAEYFSNMIIQEFKNTSNIFIDSVEIRARLSHNVMEDSYLSLYDIYKESIKEQNVIDEYYFGKNLDYNNFFIIIDGIDELISKVSNFDINQFLDSIIRYNNQIEGSKIIITCRSEYWNIERDNIQLIELKAFDFSQMEGFFRKNFNDDLKKFTRAIDLANEFHQTSKNQSEGNIYHPYALDLITLIIKQNINIKDKLETTHLNTKIKTDYIIAKMCFREKYHSGKPRVTNLSIDEQIKILEYIAIVHNGNIHNSELRDAIFFGVNKNIANNIQEIDYDGYAKSLLSHPLLKYDKNDNCISFAYDFFTDVFKAIYIAYNLSNENLLDEVKIELIRFISEFKFSSQIILDIKNRVTSWENKHKTNLSIIFEIIEDNKDLSFTDKEIMFSGLFNLAYELNKLHIPNHTTNKRTNIDLIESLGIKRNDKINNLCLIDITDERVLFDFSNVLIFENCVFNSYSSFWDLSNEWNENSFFKNCKFLNLGKRTSSKEIPWIIDNNYQNFDINSQKNMDEEFKEQIKNNIEITNELRKEIEKHVIQFVRFFWGAPHAFHSQNYTVIDGSCSTPLIRQFNKFSSLKISMEDFIEICESVNFIEWSYYNNSIKKINVSTLHRSNLKKYIQTNDKPEIVEQIEELIYDKIK
jgi:hypothetical protein